MPDANSILLNHLPAIYHESEDLRRLLAVFEAVLFSAAGAAANGHVPLAQQIAAIPELFDPHETRSEFLPWLSEWVALSHREGLSEERLRELLAEIVPLYALRGTKAYLERMLAFFQPPNATIAVDDAPLQGFTIGTSELGINTRLEPERPFWFKVTVTAQVFDIQAGQQSQQRKRWEDRIRRIIDLAKPVFTMYELHWLDNTETQ